MNTIDARLVAIDADTGALCEGFGDHGFVNLKAGLGVADDPKYQLTSAPTLAGTTVVVGGRVADNVQTDMPGGVMRGFDVITGEMRWAFDPGHDDPNARLQPGQTYARSTPNSWAPMSYDPAMNTVFIPMGSSSVDLWGGNRTPLDHRYATSILALDATTGKEKWVYQTVHNDLWDFDVPMQPSLIDFPEQDGSTKPAVVFGTKSGQIFVLDRMTGKPLTRVEERPVKTGTIPQRAVLGNAAVLGRHAADRRGHAEGIGHVGRHAVRSADVPHQLQVDALRRPLHRARHRRLAELSRLARRHELGQPVDRSEPSRHLRERHASRPVGADDAAEDRQRCRRATAAKR